MAHVFFFWMASSTEKLGLRADSRINVLDPFGTTLVHPDAATVAHNTRFATKTTDSTQL
jgi:hypothetical protein